MSDQYPQYPQYPQGGSPNQYPYPQGNPGGQPPYYPPYPQAAQYPYPQPMPGQHPYATAQQARAIKNPYATRSLIYGIISIAAVAVVFFFNFLVIGLYPFWAIYYAIRGISYSNKLPGHKGMGMAVTGLVLSIIGLLCIIGIIVLDALANSGALG